MAGTVLFVSSLAKYKKNFFFENYDSVGAGAHKVGKIVSFWPNFDSNFPDIWKA